MIPDHIIDAGARALFERDCKDYLNGGGIATLHPWEQQSPADQLAYRKRASAVICATSKRVWDSGYVAGVESAHEFFANNINADTPNPYRSVTE